MTQAMQTWPAYLFALLLLCVSCKGQEVEPARISRFDKDLFRLIESNEPGIQGELLCDYPEMLEVLGKGIINMQKTEAPGFFDRLVKFYSEPTLKGLYRDAIALYDSVTDIEQGLGAGFAYLKEHLPFIPLPQHVYMHVSGLSQNVLVGEKELSISIDKYMGKDYPLYGRFFYDYQVEKMQRPLVVPDYLAGWLMSEYPFEGKETVLLERMAYEGKIKYLVSQAMPGLAPHVLMGYPEESLAWCRKNEGALWKAIIERKHLYTPDRMATGRYFEEAPSTFLAPGAPGSLGVWFGWNIVKKYMDETGATVEMLMKTGNAQDILAKSK